MARRPHISIIILTVNGLKAPIKREWLNGYKNKTHIYAANNRLKVRFPGDSQFLCWILRLGSLMWGLKPLQQCANFLGIIVLQFVSCPTNGMGFDFIVTGPHLLSHCSSPLSLDMGYLVLVSYNILCQWLFNSYL